MQHARVSSLMNRQMNKKRRRINLTASSMTLPLTSIITKLLAVTSLHANPYGAHKNLSLAPGTSTVK